MLIFKKIKDSPFYQDSTKNKGRKRATHPKVGTTTTKKALKNGNTESHQLPKMKVYIHLTHLPMVQ